jgi:hypothetical protein
MEWHSLAHSKVAKSRLDAQRGDLVHSGKWRPMFPRHYGQSTEVKW